MKRIGLIVGGIAVVLLLIGIWAFVLFTGTTSDTVSFTDFEFGDTTDPNVIIPESLSNSENQPEVHEEANQRLHQLTTKQVAGFAEINTNTNGRQVYYIETGTGHIFSIDLETRNQERVSATTIPLASKGAITPNGKHVLIQSNTGTRGQFVVGTLTDGSDRLSNVPLEQDIVSFAATVDNNFIIAVTEGNGLAVLVYEPITDQLIPQFTIPFREASIRWHHTAVGPHIVYPKATSRLEGYVYSYLNGVVTRHNATGYGLSAVGSSAAVIYSAVDGERYTTYSLATDQLISNNTPVTLIPEKCLFTRTSDTTAICGATLDEPPYLMPDPWYQGRVVLNDSLWEYNTNSQSARLLVFPESATGRQIDLINPQLGPDDQHFYFQNKVDQTLWMYQYKNTFN